MSWGTLTCRFHLPPDTLFGIPVAPTTFLPMTQGEQLGEPLFDPGVMRELATTLWETGSMTPNRQAALRAAIDVWSVEAEGDPFERDSATRILHLADLFERWLTQPTAVRLILTPGDIRRTPK